MMFAWLQATPEQCDVVSIFNGAFNLIQVVMLAWLANRAVRIDHAKAVRDRRELDNTKSS